jgi:hypothetical protein
MKERPRSDRRIDGRPVASQIASASLGSDLLLLM